MVIENEELMQECFPKHSRMGTARMKQEKVTEQEGKKREVSMERSKEAQKKKEVLNYHNQNTIIIIIYHDFLPTPRRGSHVKSDNTHTQSSRYTPLPIYLTPEP